MKACLYIHVHKAAGTTLQYALKRAYPRPEQVLIPGKRYRDWSREFPGWPENVRAGLKLIHGHQFFGLHRYLPQGGRYITVLREPVSRLVSLYHWARLRPGILGHAEIRDRGLDLVSFIKSGVNPMVDNGMTRLIAGDDVDAVAYRESGKNTLDKALANMRKHFLSAGLMEEFDLSLCLFRRKLGLPKPLLYRSQKVNRHRPPPVPLSPEEEKQLEPFVKLDRELYSFTADLFRGQVASFGGDLEGELDAFRRRNLRFNRGQALRESMGRLFSLPGRILRQVFNKRV